MFLLIVMIPVAVSVFVFVFGEHDTIYVVELPSYLMVDLVDTLLVYKMYHVFVCIVLNVQNAYSNVYQLNLWSNLYLYRYQ